MQNRARILIAAIIGVLLPLCRAQAPSNNPQSAIRNPQSNLPQSDTHYEYRPAEDPNGIAKYYMGRQIAHVMGHQAADWLERPEREQEEQTEKTIDLLNLKPGDNVADIGAGTGYITWRMAKKV